MFHLKGNIHNFVSSTSSFLCDIGEPRYRQNKMGYQILRIRNTVLQQCWGKKARHKKVFFGPKKCFFVIFFFSCVKIVFCELMLLELSALLGLYLLRNFFSVARSIFFS